ITLRKNRLVSVPVGGCVGLMAFKRSGVQIPYPPFVAPAFKTLESSRLFSGVFLLKVGLFHVVLQGLQLMKNRSEDQWSPRGWFGAVCLAFLLNSFDAFAAEPEWKVGLAQVKITPERPIRMSGYDGRTKPFERVAADLYVKALVLEDREGRRGI